MSDPGYPPPNPGYNPPGHQPPPPGGSPYPPSTPPPSTHPPSTAPGNLWGDGPPGPFGAPAQPPGGASLPAPGGWQAQPGPGPYYAVPAAPPPLGPRPQSIKIATYLMIAGAAMNLIGMVAAFTVVDLRAVIEQTLTEQAAATQTEFPPELVDITYGLVAGFLVFQGLFGATMWLWMAWKNWQGRGWARVMSTILFALGVFSVVGNINSDGATPVLVALSVLPIVIGAVAIFFIWRPSSTDYYEGVRAQQMARPGMM